MATEQRGGRARSLVEVPVAAAVVTVIPGLVGLATGRVLLFPSLGPTALMEAHAPEHPTSRIYNVLVGHTGGLLSAYFAVWVFGLAHTPSIFALHALSPARVWASGLAILLATLIELVLRAAHPPAASTTLLAALGSFHPTWGDTLSVMAGIVIVALAGEAMRRYRLQSKRGIPPEEAKAGPD